MCHGNILEYVNTELGDDNAFFTPECCRPFAAQLLVVAKNWAEALGVYRRDVLKA